MRTTIRWEFLLCVTLLAAGGPVRAEPKNAKKAPEKKFRVSDPAPELQRQCPKGIKVVKQHVERKDTVLKTGKTALVRGVEWACRSSFGVVHGKLVRIYLDGVREEEHYRQGKRDGNFRAWYGNGQRKTEGQYKVPTTGQLKGWAGSKHGTWTHWYPDGKVKAKANYHHGEVRGKRTMWHENGRLAYEELGVQGNPLSTIVIWWDNGQTRSEGQSKSGQLHGIQRQWYPNGSKQFEGAFQDGKAYGLHQTWHPNGKRAFEGHFRDGKAVSERRWDTAGKQLQQERQKPNPEGKPLLKRLKKLLE